MLTKNEVGKIAELAKIPLGSEELSAFRLQLPKIITFVENLNKLDTKDISPTFQVISKKNELREDISAENLTRAQALQNAKLVKDGYIKTKGVLDAK
ncbi:Asp-tRNA(Asn)/Glu-tRNA(Gln) amidotransferase GatCAB subunit C [candidate division WWE3 bacterium CG09_land_8_20_14_0_10_39_24]|uniref:Aspartyl/glutamyl-tRNA(Asn/Gln) amidotransferase subunit C n=2 Tax=Katanobacteria TaxID=422282 RepID=A0A2G9XBH9_UNCKA|nr:MAG: hypothetical protein AUJ94_01870 [bacterium CG2_30_40_12]OJI08533.1 MAG: hypothetical protein BK003_02455 [bacterium CG09_39_24]PIP04297.1 MAG: Asp-tRNA(Asn)/Glu-tRNA(Gln) amidotransferase GatCAB subunit C [candidate division WWE3 bacterium CG23_combo_of_CG06-09_8_20_14_all_40_14]PIS12721.1 MAG: Asp-tRNA(Asn)/Glu-tRNA(Gln) amidotransferase GatCAB subunit C [candidate division WWE3 bacterium CG09_land_8_20_14_0_10_39_24]PJE51923.1 MAG: Asp-tRNA(Asn)/Glu-tRNA(Gln) amidotransferase GatCAB 